MSEKIKANPDHFHYCLDDALEISSIFQNYIRRTKMQASRADLELAAESFRHAQEAIDVITNRMLNAAIQLEMMETQLENWHAQVLENQKEMNL